MTLSPDYPTTVEEACERFFSVAGQQEQVPDLLRIALTNAFYAGAISAVRLVTNDLTAAVDLTRVQEVMNDVMAAADDPDARLSSSRALWMTLASLAAEFIQVEESADPRFLSRRLQFFYGGAASSLSLLQADPQRLKSVRQELLIYARARMKGSERGNDR